MNVTGQLLQVFRVEKQLRGLQGRLRTAETFLNEQSRQLEAIDAKRASVQGQLRQLQALTSDADGESKRIDARIEHLREQMNITKTNKEYQALLVEVNTLKADKARVEEGALEHMQRIEDLKKQAGELEAQREERLKVRKVASEDRDKRAEEIRERVEELQSDRTRLAGALPKELLALLEELITKRGEDAMAPIEEQDRKRHEYTCGACMMSLPVETVSGLLGRGQVTRCVSCGCLLYIEEELRERMQTASSKR